ncbi:MAG: protein NosL [Myxococcota bacterium]
MTGGWRRTAGLAGLLVIVGCGRDPGSGPIAVTWDRDTCERCQMVISDRAFAAQVRNAGGRVHLFDDIGCAILWLDEHRLRQEPGEEEPREIWVRSLSGEDWLDARTAHYESGHVSPMGYGYGARSVPSSGSLELGELRPSLRKLEDARRPAHR